MSIGKIVVPLTGTKRDMDALAVAFSAAKPFAAHVAALFVRPDPRLSLPYTGTPISPQVVQDIVDAAEEMNNAAAKTARSAFEKAAAAAGADIVKSPKQSSTLTCSFHEMEGFFPTCVSDVARLSDLVVFGPIATTDGPDLSEAFVETLTKSERPVLLAVRVPETFPGKVLLAWDASDTAARALVGALPYLKQAREIVIVSCCAPHSLKADIREVQDYLALHGLAAVGQTIDPGKCGVGEALLSAANAAKADLLVMGGYGHSKLGETIFGGVTQYVRWNAQIPVLMIH